MLFDSGKNIKYLFINYDSKISLLQALKE